MSGNIRDDLRRYVGWLTAAGIALFWGGVIDSSRAASGEEKEEQTVEFFAAVEEGAIDAKFFPRNAQKATLVVENNTDRPLRISMPRAFAGKPALAQFFPALDDGGDDRPQAVGAPGNNFPGAPVGRGPAAPRPFFSVPSGKTIKTLLPVVCLEHGKPDPAARIPYEIVRLDAVSSEEAVAEIIEQLGAGKCSQRVAQAAVWHFTHDLSWKQIDALRIEHLNGKTQRWFSMSEVQAAQKLVEKLPSQSTKSSKKGDRLSNR